MNFVDFKRRFFYNLNIYFLKASIFNLPSHKKLKGKVVFGFAKRVILRIRSWKEQGIIEG